MVFERLNSGLHPLSIYSPVCGVKLSDLQGRDLVPFIPQGQEKRTGPFRNSGMNGQEGGEGHLGDGG